MSRKASFVLIAVIVLAVAATALGGGRWFFDRLMALHGHARH
jgi:hypothetical protein